MAAVVIQIASFVAQIGASYLLGRFTAKSAPKAEGVAAQNGDYGVPIPRVYGEAVRIPCPYLVQAAYKETEHEVEDYSEVVGAISGAATGFLIGGPVGAVIGGVAGFLFGSSAPNQKYYTYSCTFALMVADRSGDDPLEAVLKIWAQGRVIFDSTQQSPVSTTLDGTQLVKRTYGQNRYFKSLTIYGGGAIQTADPVLTAEPTVGPQPGYRRRSYAVIEDFQLESFGNAMPGEFEALVKAKTGQTLAQVANAMSEAANIDSSHNISTTALARYAVRGYAVTSETNCWDALSPLMPVFRVDAGENAGQVRFYTRERGLRATIPLSEMGAYEYGNDQPERLNYARQDDTGLPRETSLSFIDPARDYQPNTATSRRSEGNAASKITTELALTLTADEGATAAATLHWDAWLGRTGVTTTLTDGWDSLTPGVCFGIPNEDSVLPYRLTRKLRGANGIIEAEFLSAENVAFQGTVAGTSGDEIVQEPTTFADTRVVALDMPITQDSHDDFGFYVAMSGTAAYWTRGRVDGSADGVTFGTLVDGSSAAIMGDVVSALPAGPTTGWDDTLDTTSVLTVELLHSGMTLSSVTDADLDALKNFAFVGQDGQGEYLQFKTATNTVGNTWELTNLRRGRRGTDWAMEHAEGDEFVLIGEGGIYRKPVTNDTGWGDELTLRGVTLHQPPEDVDTLTFTNTGEGKKPFSVINLQGSFDGGGDLTMTWDRRVRLFSGAVDATESYEVDIFKAGVFKRTITVGVEEAVYTAADQTTDGFTEGDAIVARVYMVNDDYGRGHVRAAAFLAETYALEMEDDATAILMDDDITPMGLG